VYRALRDEGTQKSVVAAMQTREELYAVLGYHAYERKLDELFAARTTSAASKRARHKLRSKRKKS
jgi:hypothetical protein